MKGRRSFVVSVFLVVVLAVAVGPGQAQGLDPQEEVVAQADMGTAFTYQGQLTHEGSPADGGYDLRFRLYDAATGGSQVGSLVTRSNVTVRDGLFTVALDFGDVFDGPALWLLVAVRPAGVGSYVSLSPRQPLTPAPYAIYAAQVGDHDHWGEVWSGSGTGLTLSTSRTRQTFGAEGVYSETGRDSTGLVGSYGVRGVTTGTKPDNKAQTVAGVYGLASATSTLTYGVIGRSRSDEGVGVYGDAHATTGASYGVIGRSRSDEGVGVYGWATATSGTTYGVKGRSDNSDDYFSNAGVYGYATATTGRTRGVYGRSVSPSGTGVHGWATSLSGNARGVYGVSGSKYGYGVYGYASYRGHLEPGEQGHGIGVYGESNGLLGIGVYGKSEQRFGYAGYFEGRVHVTGNLSAEGAKPFKIDHPLDPADRYLHHFAQEAPEVQNVYNGVVNLDATGAAVVALPDYFAALNAGPFRYQLTAIGAPMPSLHIAEEIEDNQFEIAGGVPGAKVSWEVTAVRNDPYLRDHRIEAEQNKPTDEQGTYLYPEGYGQPEEMGLDYQRNAMFEDALETATEPPLTGNGE